MKKCLILLLFTIISACSNKGTDSNDNSDYIMPLAVGNSWSFEDIRAPGGSGDTSNYALTISKDTMMTLTIESALEIGRWYCVTGTGSGTPQYLTNRGNGLWQVLLYDDMTLGRITIINRLAEFPATAGDTFMQPYPPPLQSGSARVEVISTDSLISVPAGSFNCLVYRFTAATGGRLLFDAFYAPGIGRVKTNYYELAPGDNSVTTVSRLKSYNITP